MAGQGRGERHPCDRHGADGQGCEGAAPAGRPGRPSAAGSHPGPSQRAHAPPAQAALCLPSPTTQKDCARELLVHPSFAEELQQTMAAAAAGHGPVAEAYALRAGLLALLRMAGRDLVDGPNVGVAAAVVAWAQDASLEFPPELLAGIIAGMQLHGLVAAV